MIEEGSEKMNSRIKEILNCKDVETVKLNIKCLLEEMKDSNKCEDEVIKKASAKLKKLQELCQYQQYPIYIYEEDKSLNALVCEEITRTAKRVSVEEILENVLQEYLQVFKKNRHYQQKLTKETIVKLLEDLEEQYKILSIIEKLGIHMSIMLFDVKTTEDYTVVQYNVLEEKDVSIHKYATKEENDFEYLFGFVKQIGIVVDYILVGNGKRVPDDFREMCKGLKQIPLPDDYEAKENISIFSELFAAMFFRKMNIKHKAEINQPDEDTKKLMEYFDVTLKKLYTRLNTNRKEWEDNKICPCGSGKAYKDCCKNKAIKYYPEGEDHYIKAQDGGQMMKEIAFIQDAKLKKVFGRTHNENDFFTEILYNEMTIMTRKLKYEESISNDLVYAYDRTGILPMSFNIDKLPDIEIEAFEKARKEYNQLMTQKIGKRGNLLQVAECTNQFIKKLFDENIEDIYFVLKYFIKQTINETGIKKGFCVKNMKEFLVYAAYRTFANMLTLQELVKKGYAESALATVRIVYEILLNVRTFRADRELFNKKIIPLSKMEEGIFEKIGKYKAIDKQTKEEYNYKVVPQELAVKAGENYQKLYETLYYELSGFIHFDALTAKKIFAENDNFLDIDESYIAGILAMVFAIEIVIELSEFEENTIQIKNDLRYFANKITKELEDALDMIKVIDEKEVYEVIKSTLEEYEGNYHINIERNRNKEYI